MTVSWRLVGAVVYLLSAASPAAASSLPQAPGATATQPAKPEPTPGQTAGQQKPAEQKPAEEKPAENPSFEETVVVSASRAEEKLVDAPATMSVITSNAT